MFGNESDLDVAAAHALVATLPLVASDTQPFAHSFSFAEVAAARRDRAASQQVACGASQLHVAGPPFRHQPVVDVLLADDAVVGVALHDEG